MSKLFWIIAIVVIVVALVLVKLLTHSTPTKSSTTTQTAYGATLASDTVVQDISSVPMSTLDSIGIGTASPLPKPISGAAIDENSKPEVFYMGAEFCPYCATERWAMAVALSKFGTFTNLKQTHSSTTDVYPDTQTLSFYGSTFTSPYIAFQPVELYTNIPDDGGYTTLQTPTSQEQNLVNQYDSGESIPFIDFGNRYMIAGATYSPSVLQGKSATEIASSLSKPSTAIAKGADGAANTMIAAICKLTNNQPTNVCTPAIQKIENSLT